MALTTDTQPLEDFTTEVTEITENKCRQNLSVNKLRN
jgi:hypothetical protein